MKSKIPSIIISFVIILIIAVFGIFGYIIWQEVATTLEMANIELEGVQTVFEDTRDTVEEIKTPQIVENPFANIEDSSPNTNVDYTNVQVDNYFYNQLEEYSKTIYKAFETNKENMKSGTYKIALGDSFNELLRAANGSDSLGEYYQSAIEAYMYDNPEIFYLSPNKMYLNIETITTGTNVVYNVYIDNGEESNYFADEYSSRAQVESAITQVEQVKNSLVSQKTGNTYDDIKMVHDYIINNVQYDTSLSKANIYNLYGALISKEAVCEGYARAFKYIMDEMGIPCVLVIGKGTNSEGRSENHAWNYVQLNGTWYAVDTTWDDPVTVNGGWVSESSKYRYFLKGSNDMSNDHTPSGQFTEGGKMFTYPNLSQTGY